MRLRAKCTFAGEARSCRGCQRYGTKACHGLEALARPTSHCRLNKMIATASKVLAISILAGFYVFGASAAWQPTYAYVSYLNWSAYVADISALLAGSALMGGLLSSFATRDTGRRRFLFVDCPVFVVMSGIATAFVVRYIGWASGGANDLELAELAITRAVVIMAFLFTFALMLGLAIITLAACARSTYFEWLEAECKAVANPEPPPPADPFQDDGAAWRGMWRGVYLACLSYNVRLVLTPDLLPSFCFLLFFSLCFGAILNASLKAFVRRRESVAWFVFVSGPMAIGAITLWATTQHSYTLWAGRGSSAYVAGELIDCQHGVDEVATCFLFLVLAGVMTTAIEVIGRILRNIASRPTSPGAEDGGKGSETRPSSPR